MLLMAPHMCCCCCHPWPARYTKGKIIIFVHTQDSCDNLFRDLLK